jgi:hypothetical protein
VKGTETQRKMIFAPNSSKSKGEYVRKQDVELLYHHFVKSCNKNAFNCLLPPSDVEGQYKRDKRHS